MNYDENISLEVSMSAILDAFICEDEATNVIVDFLREHDESFKDIIKNSLYWKKLFQIDFFLACSIQDEDYLMSKTKDIPIVDAAYLAWQILRSKSKKADAVKFSFKQNLDWILKYGPRHPYASRHEQYVSYIDSTCFGLANYNNIASLTKFVNHDALCTFFKTIDYSLFKNRLLQYDVFANLDIKAKYLFLNNACFDNYQNADPSKIMCMLQILASDEDDTIKLECHIALNKYMTRYQYDLWRIMDVSKILECGSFQEFMLKSMISNEMLNYFTVAYLLAFKFRWMKDWAEIDADGLDKIANVSSFVKYMANEKLAKDKSK